MSRIGTILQEWPEYEEIQKLFKKQAGFVQISGCADVGKAHMVHGLSNGFCKKIIASFREQNARKLYEDCSVFEENVVYYPAKDTLFYQSDIRGNQMMKERLNAIKVFLEADSATLVTTFDAFMNPIPDIASVQKKIIAYRIGDAVFLDRLAQILVERGYEKTYQVETCGQFAIRGGIIDIYSLTEENPYRIELFGDEIDSIRSFDVESQRSIENLEEIRIYPATEDASTECMRQTDGVSLLDYATGDEVLIFLDEPVRAFAQGRTIEEEFLESMEQRIKHGLITEEEITQIYSTNSILGKLENKRVIGLSALDMKIKECQVAAYFSINMKMVNPYNHSFELLIKDLKKYKKQRYRVVLMVPSATRAKRLTEDIVNEGLSAFYTDDRNHEVKAGEVMVVYGKIEKGYEYTDLQMVIMSESDIFGKTKKKKKRHHVYEGEHIQSFAELHVGDYVVHENHGLGIYRGIEKVEVDKVVKDYMKIEYAKGGNLYVLATQSDMIQKYAGKDAKKPKLNQLGGKEWTRTKSRVSNAVAVIAKDLVELYAQRQSKEGFCYGEDTVWQKEFEEMFPFEETEDQELAIEATKRDMESHKIMDRLICGDVGYGKTEIAIRAAFKAVQEGKQVAYLVPTTILAQQHYNTFASRMKDFPVRVDLLCRFRTPAQQKKTLEDLKRGMVDIVIGTHRLLSSDVAYKDLGLLIIDEEQRFGVTHKEKIKQLKTDVDVLTLTATPIPRTLHMSLIGIRDMSVLEEPPMDRMPIQTYVMEYNEELVREAIARELARGGQVYYVFNRVNQIEDITAKIAGLVPDANVAYAHGQMSERKLEDIMYDFVNGEIDVLVSTTIIETGLDISNVNTMIIHDADNLGLSQLYQLRGRVGRSNRTAYAFLLYKRDKLLKEVAEKRLAAIKEFTDLGSGFKIAMRDLEIRGAGNLLGAEQHGHMEAVGYDLYCKMLNEAVKRQKGEADESSYETTLDIDIDAYIPTTYIANEIQKLDAYKRIASIMTHEEMEEMQDELMDRYGDLPKSVENLLWIAKTKAMAHQCYLTEIKQKRREIQFVFRADAKIEPTYIPQIVENFSPYMKFLPNENGPMLIYMLDMNSAQKKLTITEITEMVIENISRAVICNNNTKISCKNEEKVL